MAFVSFVLIRFIWRPRNEQLVSYFTVYRLSNVRSLYQRHLTVMLRKSTINSVHEHCWPIPTAHSCITILLFPFQIHMWRPLLVSYGKPNNNNAKETHLSSTSANTMTAVATRSVSTFPFSCLGCLGTRQQCLAAVWEKYTRYIVQSAFESHTKRLI